MEAQSAGKCGMSVLSPSFFLPACLLVSFLWLMNAREVHTEKAWFAHRTPVSGGPAFSLSLTLASYSIPLPWPLPVLRDITGLVKILTERLRPAEEQRTRPISNGTGEICRRV